MTDWTQYSDENVAQSLNGKTRMALQFAADSNPDQEAEAARLAKRYNLPPDMVGFYADEYKKQAKIEDSEAVLNQSPRLKSWLAADDTRAKLTHDDLPNLSAIEQSVAMIGRAGRSIASGVPTASAGFYGAAAAPFELVGLDSLGGWFREAQKASQRAAGAWQGADPNAGLIEKSVMSGFQSAGQNLALMPVGFANSARITGEQAMLGLMGLVTGGQSYGKARDQGLAPASSIVYGVQDAAAEIITEKYLGMAGFIKNVKAGASVGKLFGYEVLKEVPGEIGATLWQNFNEWGNLNPDKPIADWIAEQPEAIAQTIIATLVGGTTQIGAVKGVEKIGQRFAAQEQQAQQAEATAEQIAQFNELATASKVLGRDADTFEQFVAQAAEDGPAQDVYISANALMQSGLAEQLAQASPAIAEQLQTALETGGDVRIPVAEYSARIAATDAAPALLDHLKFDPSGFTKAEAQVYLQNHATELQAEVERTLTDQQNHDAFKASQTAVKDLVLGELNALGRFTPAKNDLDATLIAARTAVRAAQLGITPEAMFEKQLLRLQAQGLQESAGNATLQQGGTLADVKQQWTDAGIDGAVTERDGTITLSKIIVPDGTRGKGTGTAAMQSLLDYADHTGQHVVLSPSTDFGGNKKRLIEFYKSFGFVENKGKNRAFSTSESMYRQASGKVLYQPAKSQSQVARQIGTDFLAMVKELGKGAFQYPDLILDKDLGTVLASTGREMSVRKLDKGETKRGAADETFEVTAEDGAKGYVYRFDKDVQIDVSELEAGAGRGSAIYQSVANWAKASGYVFEGDSAGITLPGILRRTENMISTIARHRDSYHVRPHPDQVRPENNEQAKALGLTGIKWATGEHEQNLGELLMASYNAIKALAPEIENVSASEFGDFTDVTSLDFTGADSELIGDAEFQKIVDQIAARFESFRKDGQEGRISPYGISTVKRAAIVGTLYRRAADAAGAGVRPDSSTLTRLLYQSRKKTDDRTLDLFADQGTADRAPSDEPAVSRELQPAEALPRGTFANRTELVQEGARELGDSFSAKTFLQGHQAPRGAFDPASNTIALLKNADLSTFLHEAGHFFFENDIALAAELAGEARLFGVESLKPGERQILADVSALLTWHGIQGDLDAQLAQWQTLPFEEKRSYHERTAESFEAYLLEGKAPSIELQRLFQTFRAWLLNVYRSLKDFVASHPEAGQLNDEVRGVFDRMLATSEQIQLAEQGRSMMPLFNTAKEAGMTPDEFAAYQLLGLDATNEAIQDLQARGLRDLQWLKNAHGKAVKKLQKAASAQRAEVMIEARREVMSQPVYRAWAFLTGKLGADDQITPIVRPKPDPDVVDPAFDTLFNAIGKLGGLNKHQVTKTWGTDPADKPQSGVFGKPLWRVDGGLSIDGMAEALGQYGYLSKDENGRVDLAEFERLFDSSIRGEAQYSNQVEGAYLAQQQRPGDQVANLEGLGAVRLDRGALGEMVAPEIAEHLVNLKMTARDGIHPDLVAGMITTEDGAPAFSSGDELVRSLAAGPSPKDAIDALTDQRMLERYGELSSQAAIERAADQAIHNDARARMVATEANALAQATGERKVLTSAAKEYAAALIARLKVRDIHPNQYASAEVRAGKAAEKASRSGDIATAAAEKRNQLINTYATRAAYDAQDEVARGVRYLGKFDREGSRKSLDIEYLDQIDRLMERFDLRKGQSNKAIDKRAALKTWLDTQEAAGMPAEIPDWLQAEANLTHYKNLTLEEFRGLIESIQQIEHLGRLKKKLLTAKDRREFAAIVEEAETSIRENGGKERPTEHEEPTGIKPWLEGLAAGHRKFASLIRQMDGGHDAGPLWRILGRGMNESATAEAVMLEQSTIALAEIYKPILALKGGTTGDLRFIPDIKASLTRGGRLAVALNWGNATNRQRVMDGDHWSQAQVDAVLSTLTAAEWRFVQGIWNHIDTYWPLIADKEMRLMGKAPEKVKADGFSIRSADGQMMNLAGGYYPIKYDANRDDRAEKHDAAAVADDMKKGAFTRASTRRGHTKQRVEEVKRPVKKTLNVITQHISEVTHDLAWHEWLIDANRLIDAKPINSAIREHYGTEVIKTMKDQLTAIATADIVPQTKIDQALLYLRANVSRSTMGLSLTTAFLQPFGLTQSMVRIGPKYVLRGMARWGGDLARFQNGTDWIREKSEFMRLRAKTFNRELHEIKGRVSHGHSQARQIYDASLFMLMQKMQMVADVPTWIGAYEKAKAENHDEDTAIALADQSVLDSQGGGQTKDMAEFQRKHPMLAMFYSYFNVTMNLAAESTARTHFKSPMAVAGWLSDMALLMVIPALGPAILLELMRGGDDDDAEGWAKKLAKWQASYLLGTVMGVREASGLVSGFDYSGPPAGRVIADLGNLGKQVAQGEADESLALSSIRLLGTATGIPTVQIIRSWRGWNAWVDGEAAAPAVLLGPPPKD